MHGLACKGLRHLMPKRHLVRHLGLSAMHLLGADRGHSCCNSRLDRKIMPKAQTAVGLWPLHHSMPASVGELQMLLELLMKPEQPHSLLLKSKLTPAPLVRASWSSAPVLRSTARHPQLRASGCRSRSAAAGASAVPQPSAWSSASQIRCRAQPAHLGADRAAFGARNAPQKPARAVSSAPLTAAALLQPFFPRPASPPRVSCWQCHASVSPPQTLQRPSRSSSASPQRLPDHSTSTSAQRSPQPHFRGSSLMRFGERFRPAHASLLASRFRF
mmetsp:Transcript_15556/g.36427  ORF Transcript_15556/g.36427 Transcript_15556/m.36427 type:complete len:273 (+) Transcript_15556:252-1070(+)